MGLCHRVSLETRLFPKLIYITIINAIIMAINSHRSDNDLYLF